MKTIIKIFALFIIGSLLVGCSSVPENYWPQFRGFNSSGIASERSKPPIEFNEKNMLWKISFLEGQSSPCIWGRYIFMTGFTEDGKQLKMYCIDRKNGTIKWEENIPAAGFEDINFVSNPGTATPATDGKRVYFYFETYGILCYDFKGKLQWKLPLPEPELRHEMGTSLIVADDLVILNCFGDLNDPHLLALNKYDGSNAWVYSVPEKEGYQGSSYATPVNYKDQIIIYTSEEVAGYNVITGKQIWRFIIGIKDAVCTPVLGNDILYIAGYSTDSLKPGIKAIKLGGQGDVSLTNLLWSNPELPSHVSSPLLYNNHFYIIRDGGILSCFNAENGKLIYQEQLEATGAYFSSLIAANDRIYITSKSGIVTVIEAGDHLNILARNDFGDIIATTPAIVDNIFYIRTSNSLCAFGE
jgi:outer membrane protein assembly factor BamB